MLSPGQRVDRYEVEALIGQGGLAEVYRVRHVDLGSLHALKLLVWKRQSLANRFVLEGRIQAQLRHPNVVTVTDLIRHDGQFGLLMEYVDHLTLEQYLAQRGSLPLDEALELMAPILAGVVAAHDVGVLHRDLKPSNILLAKVPRGLIPKVTDFGIAKVIRDDLQSSGTDAGVAMGTPGYLAPEQVVDSADADARADVFAMGVILYELLTGRRAFADETGEVVVRSTLLQEPRSLAEVLTSCPAGIAAAVAKAMARDREERFEDLRAFARTLYADYPDLLAQVEGQQTTTALALDAEVPTLEPDQLQAAEEVRGRAGLDDTFGEHLEEVDLDDEVEVALVSLPEGQEMDPSKVLPYAIGGAVLVVAVALVGVFMGWGGLTTPESLVFGHADATVEPIVEPVIAAPQQVGRHTWRGQLGEEPLEIRLSVGAADPEALISLQRDGEMEIHRAAGTWEGDRLTLEEPGGIQLEGTRTGRRVEGTAAIGDETPAWWAEVE
ncbi:MAG: serine/threonine protein kinase [Deltaproteobacteria bacterium]|nr:serine/threonine protein kinase [Deltaproteobacteria bacterium]